MVWRKRENDYRIARVLASLSDVNQRLGLYKEAIQQAKEASTLFGHLLDKPAQVQSWQELARSLYEDNQLSAAEETTFQALNLLLHKRKQFQLHLLYPFSDKDKQFIVCRCHHLLGDIYTTKGEMEEAVNHLETAHGIAASFNWPTEQYWIHRSLAILFFSKNRFDDTHTHVEHAKSHTINNPYLLGCMMELQAWFWYKQCKFDEAKSEALCAIDVFEKVGAVEGVERCRVILQNVGGE